MKKIVFLTLIAFIFMFNSYYIVYAEDNAQAGDGHASGATTGKGYYRSAEWMYKVTIYVGLSDITTTSNSLNYGYEKIGNSVFVKPTTFTVPNGTIFCKNNKVDYLNGSSLQSNSNPKIITDNRVPPIPITHSGNIAAVKSYFGDTGTLQKILDAIANQQGTTMEGLVSNIDFTIDDKTGKKSPGIILPLKSGDKYLNQVPWVIIYEPVIIAHLKDGSTKLAFTATEYAMAQKQGLFNFFPKGEDINLATHKNLPNSVTLEYNWFGFRAYTPVQTCWDNDRQIQGGGWGMRFLPPNESSEKPPVATNEEFRTNTDVILSFRIRAGSKITPDKEASVTFYVDGVNVGTHNDIVMPSGGSQYAWVKWRTPNIEKNVTVTANINSGGSAYFTDSSTKYVKIVDMNKNIPPDPRAKDPVTKKPVRKPKGYKVPKKTPDKSKNLSATWGKYTAWWKSKWVWKSNGQWVDKGHWVYEWHPYSATIKVIEYKIKPDEKVPTAEFEHNKWKMKSGYGLNIDVKTKPILKGIPPADSYTPVQTVVNYFPEFIYKDYWRLSEKVERYVFKLRNNQYSTYNNRVHFTPLWYPDDEYTVYSEIYDLWTPDGMLFTTKSDTINISGTVFDDWTIVPVR
jgi:hypothetical protein